jgi:hypothetical protein
MEAQTLYTSQPAQMMQQTADQHVTESPFRS